MSVRFRVFVVLFAGLLVFPGFQARPAQAASAAVKRIEALNAKAIAAYRAGDNEQARTLLLDAVVLAKTSGLDTHVSVAHSYLNLGLVSIDGLKDEAKGERYFAAALRIDPSIKMKAGMASDDVVHAFDRARVQAAGARAKDASDDNAAPAETAVEDTRPADPAPAPPSSAERAPDPEAVPRVSDAEARVIAQKTRQEEERLRKELAAADAQVKKGQGARDRQRLEKMQFELDHTRGDQERLEAERNKLQAERDTLASEKRDLESQLADARSQGKRTRETLESQLAEARAQAQKTSQAADKALSDNRAENQRNAQKNAQAAERQLADAKSQSDKATRDLQKQLDEARSQGEKTARDLQKQLAEAKSHAQDDQQRAQKEKAGVEKKLADAEEREKKERLAKEQLQQDKKLADEKARADEKAAREAETAQKQARERLAAGPDLPARLPQKLTCSLPDASPPGADVFIHCALQAEVKAEELTLYYRPSGSPRYSSIPMVRTSRGWYSAMVPAAVIKGTMLQYYAEADSERGRAVATNGKSSLPNVVMVNRIQAQALPGSIASTGGALVHASARHDRARDR